MVKLCEASLQDEKARKMAIKRHDAVTYQKDTLLTVVFDTATKLAKKYPEEVFFGTPVEARKHHPDLEENWSLWLGVSRSPGEQKKGLWVKKHASEHLMQKLSWLNNTVNRQQEMERREKGFRAARTRLTK